MANQFAQFDTTKPAPQQVTGWYDNNSGRFSNLPPVANTMPSGFVEVDGPTWQQHLADLMLSNWTVVDNVATHAVVPFALTFSQQAQGLIQAGLTVTSTSTPSLNAVYPCTEKTQSKMAAIEVRLAANLGFPNGAQTQPWKDSAGNWHELTVSQFVALAQSVSNFVAACDLIIDGNPDATTLPTAAVTIP